MTQALETRPIRYSDGETEFEGWLAMPEAMAAPGAAPAPGILMAPAFGGVAPGMKANAERLAATGRPVMLLDPYGVEAMAKPDRDPMAMMTEMTSDRAALRRRLLAALETLRALPFVDAQRIGAAGYCFGGLCALDLARAAPADVLALAQELTEAGADWQLHAYGHALHAFTTPQANTPGRAVYDATADRRSFAAMTAFFAETLDA